MPKDKADTRPSRGVIYVATGQGYLDLAADSARSLRQMAPDLDIDIFVDPATLPAADGLVPFDRVLPVPRVHPRAKIDCLPLTRFDRTLYLDCDTLAIGPLGDLFDVLDRFELAIAHDMRRASDLVQESGFATTPYAFPQMNSGVMLYRRSPAMWAFLADWQARYRALGVLRDQVSLKDILWQSDLRFYVLPPEFNLRRVTMLDAWEPLDVRPAILHSHRLLDHLRDPGAPRLQSLDDIRDAERAALAAEWARAANGCAGAAMPAVPHAMAD